MGNKIQNVLKESRSGKKPFEYFYKIVLIVLKLKVVK